MSTSPCPRCGSSERYASGHCKSCQRSKVLAYQSAHRTERNASREAWRKQTRAANPELARQKDRERSRRLNQERLVQKREQFRLDNPDYWRQWQAANREKVREAWRQRRVRQIHAPGQHTLEQLQARAEYYGRVCWICRRAPATAIDHVLALCNGGADWPANLRPVCHSCNSAKAGWERTSKKSIAAILAWANRRAGRPPRLVEVIS